MENKSLLRNNHGVSLVSMVVAIPLACALVAFLGSLSTDLFQRFQESQAKNNAVEIQDYLRKSLQSGPVCTQLLHASSRKYNPVKAQGDGLDLAFTLDDNTSVIASNQDLRSYGVRVNSLKFKALNGGASFQEDPAQPQNNLYYGTLHLNASELRPGGITKKDAIVSGLMLSVNPTTLDISRCFLTDGEFDLCGQLGGNKVVAADGTVTCQATHDCGSLLWTGFDASGNPVCKSLPTLIGEFCPAGETLVANGSGSAICRDPAAVVASAPPPPGGPPICATSGSGNLCVHGQTNSFNMGGGMFYNGDGVVLTVTIAGNNVTLTPGPEYGKFYGPANFTINVNRDSGGNITSWSVRGTDGSRLEWP